MTWLHEGRRRRSSVREAAWVVAYWLAILLVAVAVWAVVVGLVLLAWWAV